jgi:hypothetical protein
METTRLPSFGIYLVVIGNTDGDYIVTTCENEYDVYQALTDFILNEIDVVSDYYESQPERGAFYDQYKLSDADAESMRIFIDVVKSNKIITNPVIITNCFEIFAHIKWWFKVIDADSAEIWFEGHGGDDT